MFSLTPENYHTPEANQAFMSSSQFGDFQQCEAYGLARSLGEWDERKSGSFEVGDYLHAWNEGTLDKFQMANPGVFSSKGPTKGELKAEYRHAEVMIATLESDPLCMRMLQGEKEVILTAEFAGCWWKIKLDVYNAKRDLIVDLKTTKSIFEYNWSESARARVSFIEEYHYMRTAAIYCEIERLAVGRDNYCDYFLVAVSKEKVPDREVIDMRDHTLYGVELDVIRARMPRILAIKNGEIQPNRCGCCDYCRSTKRLEKPIWHASI